MDFVLILFYSLNHFLPGLSAKASQVSLSQILMCVFFRLYISELNTVTQLAFSIKEKCGGENSKIDRVHTVCIIHRLREGLAGTRSSNK